MPRFSKIILGISALAAAASWGAPYQTELPRRELRASLNELIEYRSRPGASQHEDGVEAPLRLLETYRVEPESSGPVSLSIKDAPFAPLIVLDQAPKIFAEQYQTARKREFERVLRELTVVDVFDGLIDAYRAGELPPSIEKQVSALGKCMAKKVARAKGEGCALDPDETRFPKVSKLQLGVMRAACPLPLVSPKACTVRKTVFAALKKQLVAARHGSPEFREIVRKQFEARFPLEFRKGFLEEIAARYRGFGSLAAAKFGGDPGVLWSDRAPLVETDGANGRVTLHGFGAGLRADIGAARWFAEATLTPRLRPFVSVAPALAGWASKEIVDRTGAAALAAALERLAKVTLDSFADHPSERPAAAALVRELGELAAEARGRSPEQLLKDPSAFRGRLHGLSERARALLDAVGDAKARGAASALLYAAANRLLVVTGGTEAAWDPQTSEFFRTRPTRSSTAGRFAVRDPYNPTSPYCDPKKPQYNPRSPACDPLRPPRFESRPFGGWALGASGFAPWDWAEYDPTRAEAPTPFLLFPTELAFGADSRWRPRPVDEPALADERLSDLAELLTAVGAFLESTRPGTALGAHFGSEEELGGILEPEQPILFPRQGRRLALGVLKGAFLNLIAPQGHMSLKDVGAGGAIPLSFADPVRLGGRPGAPVSVESVARILTAVADLRGILKSDPDSPPELLAYLPQADVGLQAGALVLGAQGQEPDGGFREVMDAPQASGRRLVTQLAALRALNRAYADTEMLVHLFRIKNAWVHLDRFWGAGAVPWATEGTDEPLPPSAAWMALNLWDECKTFVRQRLTGENAPEIDWGTWEGRFEQLRARLTAQLRAETGPAPLAPSGR